jgi:hypothetical protein
MTWMRWSLVWVMAHGLSAGAGWIETRPGAVTGVRLVAEQGALTRLVCEVAGFESRDQRIGLEDWQRIRVPGAAITLEAGAPELPVLAASVIIPDRGARRLRVIAAEHVDLPLRPVPSKGNLTRDVDPADLPWTFGPAYRAAAWPREQALLREPYILRDHRGQTVLFQPFQYLPGEGLLRVYTRLEVELETDPAAGEGANPFLRQEPPARLDKDFAAIYRQRFLNYDEAARYTPAVEEGRLLIICHDAFLEAMAPFVTWKRQKGLEVDLVPRTLAGATAAAIQSYVAACYQSPGLASLLLVGDAEQVPSPLHSGGSSDPSYAMLAGGDHYPDILVGRFSAATVAQVETMVRRCVEYERDPQTGADWYHKATGVASAEGTGIGDDGEADWVHLNNIRTDLLGYTYTVVDQIYDPGASAASVSAALNQGRGFINYCGHGSTTSWGTTGFSNSHVNALTNENRLPFIVDVACVNGQFAGTTCFAEAWMRATRNGNPTGAVGIYASTINQSWAPPMAAQDECTDLLAAEACLSFGALCYNGAMRMNDDYADWAMTRTWTIFTDPTLQLRTASPLALTVGHAAELPVGAASFPVQTGAPGARATLWGEGGRVGTALADATGLAQIEVEEAPAAGQALTLTVTAFNHETYQGLVTAIAPEGPWISLTAAGLQGDGLALPGAAQWLDITLANVGTAAAADLSLSLASAHPGVAGIIGSPALAFLPAGATAQLGEVFQIQFSTAFANGEALPFLLTVEAGEGEAWSAAFTLSGRVAPRVETTPQALFFSALPGQTASGQLVIANTGHADLSWSLAAAGPPSPAAEERSMLGSTLSAAETEFVSGAPLTLHLSLFNGSPDNEWATAAALQLPAGVTALASSDLAVAGGGRLQTDGVTGEGVRLTWSDPDGGWGNIYPNQTAVGTVQLDVPYSFSGDLTLAWDITGDIYGADPHVVSGAFTLAHTGDDLPQWLEVQPAQGLIPPGGSLQAMLTASALGLEEGQWTGLLVLSSNDPVRPLLHLPISFQVGGLPPVAGLRIVQEANCLLRLEWEAVPQAATYRIWQSEDLDQPFLPLAECTVTNWSLPCRSVGTRLFRVTALTP